MATSPTYALIHVFIPNLLKLKGAASLVLALERKEKAFLEQNLWSPAFVSHDPYIRTELRDPKLEGRAPFRVGVLSLPPPKDLGEAYFAGVVVRNNDPSFARYFTLEHDYVLAKKANRTLVCEREGQKHIRHFEGPALTGTPETDATAFIDAFMELIIPTRVQKKS